MIWRNGFAVTASTAFCFIPRICRAGSTIFLALVIPELQSRGLFRAEYEGTTLRENMGLERPKSRYLSP